MSEKKVVVPEGMLRAAMEPCSSRFPGDWRGEMVARLEAALRWLSENPIVPTDEQSEALWREFGLRYESWSENTAWLVSEWQRRMFLAPEPEVPEEIKDLIRPENDGWPGIDKHNTAVIEAYRRGKESKR